MPRAHPDGITWPVRLHTLDVSRAVAALAVVLWHWQHFAYVGTSLPASFERSQQPLYGVFKVFYDNGGAGVDYFFLLSGFVFFWRYRAPLADKVVSGRNFAVARFSRLYPLHLVTLLMVAALQFGYQAQTHQFFVYGHNDAYHFLLNLGFAPRWGFEQGWSFNAPVWSVSIEVLLYAAFFVVAIRRSGGFRFCLGVALIAYLLQFVVHSLVLGGLELFFLGGALLHGTRWIASNRRNLRRPIMIVVLVGWLLAVGLSYVGSGSACAGPACGTGGDVVATTLQDFVLFPATICALALLELEGRISWKAASPLGDLTYSTYLLHFPLQLLLALAVALGLLRADFYLSPWALALFVIVLGLLAHLTFSAFEMPMQRVLRGKLGTNRTPRGAGTAPVADGTAAVPVGQDLVIDLREPEGRKPAATEALRLR